MGNFLMKALLGSCLVCDCDLTCCYVCSGNYICFEVFGTVWTIVLEWVHFEVVNPPLDVTWGTNPPASKLCCYASRRGMTRGRLFVGPEAFLSSFDDD